MIFILKQYNFELLTFELCQDGLNGFECSVLSVNEANRKLLPPGMTADGEGVLAWLKARFIPRNRDYSDRILSVYGLSHNNLFGIIKLSLGLSLNDSYWCVPEGFSGRFSKFNLYENPFNRTLAQVAYTGLGRVRSSEFISSPEFTTNGNLRKAWRKVNGRILLYKGGSSGASNTGNEPYSEYYATQIASAMHVNHVPYNIARWKDEICGTCGLFSNIDHSFVPAHRFFPKLRLMGIAAELKKMGDAFYQPFCDMIVFDALVCNTDRHLGNFGLMIDNKRNIPDEFAPLFDNGMALFPFAMKDDFDVLNRYAQSQLSVYGIPFSELVSAFMTNRQRKRLSNLTDFRFERHRYYNLPAWRLKKLEAFIHDRAHELISLSGGTAK